VTSNQGEGANGGPAWEGSGNARSGGKRARRLLVLGAVVAATAAIFSLAVALSLGRTASDAAPKIVAAVAETPASIFVPSDTPTAAPTPTLTDAATAEPTDSPLATAPATIDDAWSSTPDVSLTPAPTSVGDPVASLITSIEAQYGVHVVVIGQNWGANEGAQLRNIGAVQAALAGVPSSVRAAAATNAGGSLTFLSNDTGSTVAGWQPYGARAANYYSNEDIVNGARIAANEVVLQPGSSAQTVAHELMHSYQMRGLAPGDYAGALLTPEIRSFMAATGWMQLVRDDEVRSDSGAWDALNADFAYNGRPLDYVNEWGTAILYAPNPLEAYAEAGGLFYGHSAYAVPDWPEYWGWFSANVG
jgi:hypothetical protein